MRRPLLWTAVCGLAPTRPALPPAPRANPGEPEAEQRQRGRLWDDILRGQCQVVQRLAGIGSGVERHPQLVDVDAAQGR